MLVLTRKVQEAISVECAGGPLKLTVLEIRNGRVKLGFAADNAIPITRWEVLQRNQAGVVVENLSPANRSKRPASVAFSN
jgi:carbon storage regulator CsrA